MINRNLRARELFAARRMRSSIGSTGDPSRATRIYNQFQDLKNKYLQCSLDVMSNPGRYPEERFKGRGIVICAGGHRYTTCAYVLIRRLRDLGCNLPIEVWYLGKREMDEKSIALFTPYNVRCVDAYEVRRQFPARTLNGWELNPYSMINSSFEEFLFLDADNYPLKNPEYLFDCQEYKDKGAIFWPDYLRLSRDRLIWYACNVEYKDEPEFESGQVLVNKRRCWRELMLTMYMNENSDYYYRLVHGDKETYHMAWRMCGTPYHMINRPILKVPQNGGSIAMGQHDPNGELLFLHRNMDKWNYSGVNVRVAGFVDEAKAFEYIEQLRGIWDGQISKPVLNPNELIAYNWLINKSLKLRCIENGYVEDIKLLEGNHLIVKGCDSWFVQNEGLNDATITLTINSGFRTKYKFTSRISEINHWLGYSADLFDRFEIKDA